MATLALATAGAVIGGTLFGPAGVGPGFAAGTILGSILFPPDAIEGPRLSDLKVSASTYGKPIPICYGTMRIGGNMIWGREIKERDREVGGKGGAATIEFSYFGNFAMAFTEGPIVAILRIWADGKLILDLTGNSPVVSDVLLAGGGKDFRDIVVSEIEQGALEEAQLSGVNLGRARLYFGSETQLPDPWIQADKGVDDTPAYRGLSYIVFQDLPLEDFGNRYPQITAEIACDAAATYPSDVLTGGFGTSSMRWRPDYQHLFAAFGFNPVFVSRIDALGQTVLLTVALDSGEHQINGVTFEFNSSGDFYADTLVIGRARIYRIDSDTFQFFAATGSGIVGNSDEWTPILVADCHSKNIRKCNFYS